MITQNSIAIYYQSGAYGTFVEWCLNYFTDKSFAEELPFTHSGSAHKFIGNPIFSHKMYQALIDDSKCPRFVRFHPGTLLTNSKTLLNSPEFGPYVCYQNEIKVLESCTKQLIILYYNMDSILWGCSNIVTKTSANSMSDICTTNELLEFIKNNNITHTLHVQTSFVNFIVDNLQSMNIDAAGWSTKNLDQLSIWELREFLSFLLYDSWKNTNDQKIFNKLIDMFPSCLFVEISDLRDNFENTIQTLVKSTGMPMIRKDKLNHVYDNWIKLQKYANRDKLVKEIVNNTIKNKNFDWSNIQLSIYDEAMIQKQLRDRGYKLKCFELNTFPNSSNELYNLIYAT